MNKGASNSSFIFLNHDNTEADEKDEKNTLKSSSSSVLWFKNVKVPYFSLLLDVPYPMNQPIFRWRKK